MSPHGKHGGIVIDAPSSTLYSKPIPDLTSPLNTPQPCADVGQGMA